MNFAALIDNRTPLATLCVPLDDDNGQDVAVMIAKLTYEVDAGGRLGIALRQEPVRNVDDSVSWEAGMSPRAPRSIRRPSDLQAEKPGTDVLLVGTAHPPAPHATTADVTLQVARGHELLVDRRLRVRGPSVWYASPAGVVAGPPGRMEATSLVYEYAFGGTACVDGTWVSDARNPVGMGISKDKKTLVGKPAPRIEDPAAPLGRPDPKPAGFGPIAMSWEPRSKRFGTLDVDWARSRAPLLPKDFDPRARCCAPEGQWLATPLLGDEAIGITGTHPGGPWRFRLPAFHPQFFFVVRGQRLPRESHLDTLLVDADAGTVELTWRASLPLPKRTNTLERIEVRGALPERLLRDLVERAREAVAGERRNPPGNAPRLGDNA